MISKAFAASVPCTILQDDRQDHEGATRAEKVKTRAQPWKKNWPPKDTPKAGPPYGFEKGEIVVIYGN